MLRPLPEGAWPLSTARYEQDMGVSRFGGLIIAVLVGEIYFYPFPLLFQELASLLLPALTNGAVRIVTAGGLHRSIRYTYLASCLFFCFDLLWCWFSLSRFALS